MSGGRSVGLLHPGAMGAAVAADLGRRGARVLWVPAGRSAASAARAEAAGATAVGSLGELAEACEVVLSICPPSAALKVAADVAAAGFRGTYVDCNAVSPRTAGEVMAVVRGAGGRAVDAAIVGPPPSATDCPRLYLSGEGAAEIAALFGGGGVEPLIMDGAPTAASALKMLYAAWTKGSAALLLAIDEAAREADVAAELRSEWEHSTPDVPGRLRAARRDRGLKGPRWVGEMEEVAATFGSLAQPEGFHEAAAVVFENRATEERSGQ